MPVLQLFKWSPRPDQTPDGSPASQSSSRFGPFSTLHANVRSMVNGSSVYSQSPNLSNNNNTPKIPFLDRFRREQLPAPIAIPGPNDPPRNSTDSRSPLWPPHTAGTYMRTIAPLHDVREPERTYDRGQRDAVERHPADVQLNYNSNDDRGLDNDGSPEEINRRRRRRRHHHRRRRHNPHHDRWVRRRSERGTCLSFVRGTAARAKLMSCIISGLFLMTVLAIYLALALSRSDLGQEVHVLFIMIVLALTIFFCHSLVRLCMLILHPKITPDSIPDMTGSDGFHPAEPIQVHLARDEDLNNSFDEERDLQGSDPAESMKEKPVPLPPPAYGLWRSSVRVDPNLLHWQRVDDAQTQALPNNNNHARSGSAISNTISRNSSVVAGERSPADAATSTTPMGETGTANNNNNAGPRPPSYVSEDGVSYIVEAAPRSVAPSHMGGGVSDIHPAWRPGYCG